MTESEVSDMQQPVEIQYKDDDLQLPTHVFARMVLDWFDNLLGGYEWHEDI